MKASTFKTIYKTAIIIELAILLILAYAVGGMKICNEMGGRINNKLECNPLPNQTTPLNNYQIEINNAFKDYNLT